MRTKLTIWIIIVTCLFILEEGYSESTIRLTLSQMTYESKYIFIGTILKTEEYVSQDSMCNRRQLTTIFIDKSFMNAEGLESLVLDTCNLPIIDDGIFSEGETALFFVEEWKGKYRTVQGSRGKLLIKDNMIESYKIKGYPDELRKITGKDGKCFFEQTLTNLDSFVHDINNVIKETNIHSE